MEILEFFLRSQDYRVILIRVKLWFCSILNSSYLSRLTAMLVDGLLWSDVGQSLLKVVGIGIEVVDKLFIVYGR